MRVLIVDDDESVHLYLDMVLSRFANCDFAFSGPKALEMFDAAHVVEKPYHAVFMDILMPGMDGHQCAELMRDREDRLGIEERDRFKLVMITALVDDANVSRAFFRSHASCYLVKPFEKEHILEELKANLIL
ncbi:response regulator [Pseudodesulfovibrio tunisiensis]|uniref:response regulator n=1 Tax=Pseudodesulfovibrio tunisiensis TaxID=463192 RepID=UPI001FB1A75F|nr:response regulator [Pseudodesulfovibrio tunisiensis]